MESLVGKKFGKLLIIDEFKDRHGRYRVKCKCDCGNEKVTCKYHAKRGGIKSCGCLGTGRKPLAPGKSSYTAIYNEYKWHAKNRGYSFKLTKDQFIKIGSSDCHYCGALAGKVTRQSFVRLNGDIRFNGVDRKNNSKGYILENCVPCCSICNKAKGTMSYRKFKIWIKKLVNFYKRR